MFTVEIAEIPINIDNRYEHIRILCQGYLTEKDPVVSITVTEEEIQKNAETQTGREGYDEVSCVFQQIANAIIPFDAFFLHAAVLAINGKGVAFAAKSGIGKTTRLNLWEEAFGDKAQIVNGDKPVLRFLDGQLYAYGTPWKGKEINGNNVRTPLNALCFLERSDEVSLQRISIPETLSRIFSQVFVPEDEQSRMHFLGLIDRMIQCTPCFLLKCNKGKEKPVEIWDQMEMEILQFIQNEQTNDGN